MASAFLSVLLFFSAGLSPMTASAQQARIGEGAHEGESGTAGEILVRPSTPTSASVELNFFYSPDCRSCIAVIEETLPKLAERHSTSIRIHRRNIMDQRGFEALGRDLSARGLSLRAFPVLMSRFGVLQGEGEIRDGLSELIRSELRDSAAPIRGARLEPLVAPEPLLVLPVLAAGLIDGINPCAFTTIIFLLSSLALAGRSRRDVLAIGAGFTASVFVTYTAIGFGALALLRSAELFPLLSRVLRYGMTAALVVLALLSLVDFMRIRRGRPENLLLQLPLGIKLRLHALIRDHRRSRQAILGSMVLGALVATFELGCTGQIYLPTLIYMVKVEKGLRSYLMLLLYNVAFILPLLIVFAASYIGVGVEAVTKLFQRNLAGTKLLTALVFVLFAALLILL